MELTFITGGAIRRVFVKGREVSLLTAELGNTPLVINLDKLNDQETKKKLEKANMDENILKDLSQLETEEEISKDIIKDFQRSGWRLLKKE